MFWGINFISNYNIRIIARPVYVILGEREQTTTEKCVLEFVLNLICQYLFVRFDSK